MKGIEIFQFLIWIKSLQKYFIYFRDIYGTIGKFHIEIQF